ncbi:beta-ketoacyl-ACP reductase [Spirochaetia bacterium]|nr:beta-ketoacyl-ACP reductase [Spirochaetia bacterium]
MEKIFTGKNALVIGGTGGIGRAVAQGLAVRGARLVLHGGSSRERLDGALELIRAAGGAAEGFLYPADGAGPGAAAAAILTQARDLCGGASPQILICAWGPFKQGSLEDMGPEDWQRLVENNLIFPGIMVSSLLGDMMKRRWGRILLFGGTNTDTIRGFRTTAVYSAAKTALGALAKSVARSAGPLGVTCNVICPGLTDTEYTGDALGAYNLERSPGGEVLKPEDIAKIALGILENPQVNGGIIPVDRGLVL